MSVQRFTGANNREAMGRVRAALGDDALILANRSTPDGVEILAVAEDEAGPAPPRRPAPPPRSASPAAGSPSTAPDAGLSEQLLREVRDLRARLDARGEDETPARRALRRRLAALGLGAALSDDLLAGWPEEAGLGGLDPWLRRQLRRRLLTGEGLEQDGTLVVLGPAGVGKTSVALKLAARAGAARARLWVETPPPPALARRAEGLGLSWEKLDQERPVPPEPGGLTLIDTRGRGLRDPDLGAALHRAGPAARPVLVLPAGAAPETLEETLAVYRGLARAAGRRLDDVIVTGRDDAARLGPLLDLVLRHGLRLHYLSAGQRIPEDLTPARPEALLDDLLATPDSDELERAPAVGDRRWAERLLDQSRALDAASRLLRDGVPAFRELLEATPGGGLATAGPDAIVHGAEDARVRLALDPGGLPLGPVSDHGDGARLLPSLPDAALWHRLGARPWLASARGNGRVWLRGERHALEESRARAVAWDSRLLRHRGRAVQARLRRLDVAAPVAGGGAAPLSARLCAWFASLHDLDTGAELGQRYWLAPGDQDRERTLSLLVASLSAEGLPALERRARLTLDREGLAAPAGAAGLLASLALRLDLDDGDWALDARGQLLALLGGRRRRKPETLLDALLALLRARHSLRDLGRDLGLEP
ncbi:flagellar biosynthesis protein FlhF [Alloalcanivorax profundimaris]|uniref:hypothetical protein n=1 Tax=Alloalcanivorax profundimaris TaxID=2735259 RepID=UPI001886CA03|nr:hypothetical protein [Alloalcanivorax profundimaris]MBF1800843.1 hypothetical protein [Alloalcanivorax profundimaris]